MYFSELNLEDNILDALDAMRFEKCTPIQERAIPPLLEGKDIIGVAQTGTGKTAAYLLPILNRLATEQFPPKAINCVIMVPTRELAQQIDQSLEAFSYFMPISGVSVYGGNDGVRYEQEIRALKLGADIIIATPGRLISHIKLGNVNLSQTSIFVLDEADRMLDMGFIDDVKSIVKQLPEKRQTMLFSATMPDEIQSLAKSILHDPVSVEIAIAKPASHIDQSAYICFEKQKLGILRHLFSDPDLKRVIIFSSSKVKVRNLAAALSQRHLNVMAMHSDLNQKQRDEVMRAFKNGKIDIIVSTDLLSRGIDIDDIEMVINYDVPRTADDYVHRIGRTARANKYGKAITLVSPDEQFYFHRIERVIEKEVRKDPLPEGLGDAPAYEPEAHRNSRSKNGGRFDKRSQGTDYRGQKSRRPATNNKKTGAKDSRPKGNKHRHSRQCRRHDSSADLAKKQE
ncbi:MAG: DEAD/DEAH box helicase [Prevotellaceae bacterium]|nr:DEAD/DEAH box helicase [Prevotellaceae bacterium]MDY3856684.1 DEAD/DEAH box helicase [Bacteroidaceae bacterium]